MSPVDALAAALAEELFDLVSALAKDSGWVEEGAPACGETAWGTDGASGGGVVARDWPHLPQKL